MTEDLRIYCPTEVDVKQQKSVQEVAKDAQSKGESVPEAVAKWTRETTAKLREDAQS